MWHVWGTEKVHIGVWWGDLMKRDHLKDPDVVGRITLQWIFKKFHVGAWTVLLRLRIETGGGRL
jgi:hypothetical protein